MQQITIQQRPSYVSVWIFGILGLFIWPLLPIAIILAISKYNDSKRFTTTIITQNENNVNGNNKIDNLN